MSAPIKVRVTLTVEVDPEAWDLEYGNGATPAEVREDVRRYMLNHAQQATGIVEAGATVSLAS